jgi:hypothetical protein
MTRAVSDQLARAIRAAIAQGASVDDITNEARKNI